MPDVVEGPVITGPHVPTKVSPKVIAAAVWALLAPALVAALLAGLGYLMTDDGRTLLAGLPVILQVAILAAASSLGAGLAGYVKPDRLRELGQTVIDTGDAWGTTNAERDAQRDADVEGWGAGNL